MVCLHSTTCLGFGNLYSKFIAICEKSKGSEKIKAVLEANASKPVPQWMDVDREKLEAKVIALPNRDQIDAPIEEQLIVEFYSK